MNERITARGHPNISSKHRNTLEFTKEDYVTPRGDCIVAISADRGPAEFSDDFKNRLKDEKTRLEIKITCDGASDKVMAYGHPDLTFKNSEEMVVRKSGFVCDRTLAIKADKSAFDLDRELVRRLKNPKNEIEIILKIKK